MKTKIVLLLATLILIPNHVKASTWEGRPKTIQMLPTAVYLPPAYDDNDNVKIFIEGQFPSSCFKVAPETIDVDAGKGLITISNNIFYYPESLCITMVVPYTRIISIGTLKAGDYNIEFKSASIAIGLGYLQIQKAKNKEADDYLYMPTAELDVNVEDSGKSIITLRGEFSNSCMTVDRIEIKHEQYSNVIDVLPIARIEGTNCSVVKHPFEYQKELLDIPPGRYLIHTRVLNGQSLFKIHQFKD